MPLSPPQTKQSLQIHPTPFKPTFLSIPPSPFSPQTPLAPTPMPQTNSRIYPDPDPSAQPLTSPLQWIWQCHQCRRSYPLGATRRCLEDGHMFCAGTTTVKNWRKALNPRKAKKHRACGSEFDYRGWKSFGRWRRSGRRGSIYDDSDNDSDSGSDASSSSLSKSSDSHSTSAANGGKSLSKDCWNTCDYPSECRWGRQFGVHTPLTVDFPALSTETLTPRPPSTTFEGILKHNSVKDTNTGKKTEKTDIWSTLVASAMRRKSVHPSSPLANVPEEPSAELEAQNAAEDKDGDVVMSTTEPFINPQQLTSVVAASITASAPAITLKEIIKKTRLTKSSKEVDSKKSDLVVQASPIAAAMGEFEGGFESREDLHSEFALLERVKSRNSGLYSTADLM